MFDRDDVGRSPEASISAEMFWRPAFLRLPIRTMSRPSRGRSLLSISRDQLATWLPLVAVLAVALFFNVWGLTKTGYGNTYYAAAVRSMTESWHNFFFGAFDPGGFITVDKPPVFLWIDALFARVFGYSSTQPSPAERDRRDRRRRPAVADCSPLLRRLCGDHRRPRPRRYADLRGSEPPQPARALLHPRPHRRCRVRPPVVGKPAVAALDHRCRRPRRHRLQHKDAGGLDTRPRPGARTHRAARRATGAPPGGTTCPVSPSLASPRWSCRCPGCSLSTTGPATALTSAAARTTPCRTSSSATTASNASKASTTPLASRGPAPAPRPARRHRHHGRAMAPAASSPVEPDLLRMFDAANGGQIAWFLPFALIGGAVSLWRWRENRILQGLSSALARLDGALRRRVLLHTRASITATTPRRLPRASPPWRASAPSPSSTSRSNIGRGSSCWLLMAMVDRVRFSSSSPATSMASSNGHSH